MYQPRIEDEHIQQLYQWAKRLEMPMTRLVNALLAHALVRLEQGVENVSEPPAVSYRQKKRKKRRAQYGKPDQHRGVRHDRCAEQDKRSSGHDYVRSVVRF